MTLGAALGSQPFPAFAVVLIGPMLWARFEAHEGKVRLDFNENTVGASPQVLAKLQEVLSADLLTVYPEYSEVIPALARFLKGLSAAKVVELELQPRLLRGIEKGKRAVELGVLRPPAQGLEADDLKGNVQPSTEHACRLVIVEIGERLPLKQAAGSPGDYERERDQAVGQVQRQGSAFGQLTHRKTPIRLTAS